MGYLHFTFEEGREIAISGHRSLWRNKAAEKEAAAVG